MSFKLKIIFLGCLPFSVGMLFYHSPLKKFFEVRFFFPMEHSSGPYFQTWFILINAFVNNLIFINTIVNNLLKSKAFYSMKVFP